MGNKVIFSLLESFDWYWFQDWIQYWTVFTHYRYHLFLIWSYIHLSLFGSDSLEFFDVKWFLCACKLYSEIHPQIRRVLTCPHSLPSVSCLPSQAFILSSWHCTWSLTLFSSSFSLHMKRSPSFGLGSKTRRVRPTFVLRHSKIPHHIVFLLWLWWLVLQTASVAADCGDICIAWDLWCLNASEMCLGNFLSSIHMHIIWIYFRETGFLSGLVN